MVFYPFSKPRQAINYLKKFTEETLEGTSGGVHLILEAIHQHTKERLVALSCCYSISKTLFFMRPGAESTRPGVPYEMKYPTEYDNVGFQFFSCPDVVSKYFQLSNIIDMHNKARRFELTIEKSGLLKIHTSSFTQHFSG
jgi:hypothetical protein